jgi:PAS domain S-box-containing protein
MTKIHSCNTAKDRPKHTLEMLRALCDGIDEIIYVADPNTGEILFANKKTRELFGKNMAGKTCHLAFYGANKPCPFCANKNLLGKKTGKTRNEEFQNRRNKHWYRCMEGAIKWFGDKYVRFGIAIDITEQKATEDALWKSEKQYRNLVETAPIIIYTISADGTFQSLNPEFEKITGWSRKEWLGKSFLRMVHPGDLPLAKETFQRTLRGETSPPHELRVLSKSGEYIVVEFTSVPVIEKGKVVGKFGIVQDIAERKRMESALRESEELFRSIVENSHEAILIAGDDFRITYANDEAVDLSGYSKQEIMGQDFRKFLDESDKPVVEDRYLRRQNGETVPRQYEFKIVRKNGEKKDVEIRSAVIRDKHGITRTIAQLLDISENKRIEGERKRFEERLSALNMYGQSLNSAKNMEEIYKLTLDAMEKTLGFEFASVFMIEGKTLRLKTHRKYPKKLKVDLPLDGKKGITVRTVTTGKPVFVPDVSKEKTYVGAGLEGMHSELAVPINVKNRVLGVLNVESKKLAAFDEEDRKLLEILASHAAIAISNLKRQEKLSALNIYGRSLNKAEDTEEICNLTLNAMREVLGFRYVDVFLVEGKTLRLADTRGLSKGQTFNLSLEGKKGVTVRAARTGEPVFVPDVGKEKTYVAAGVRGMLSELAVPVRLGNSVLGVLNVESDRLAAFDEEDRELLEILASHISIAISNLKRREQLRKLSKRLEHLMKSSTEVMHITDTHERLRVIAKAIQNFGWRRIVISLRDENLEGTDRVTVGLTKQEIRLLRERRQPGQIWKERLGPKFERFKIGEFFYLPWTDSWIREYVHHVPPGTPLDDATTYTGVPSQLSLKEMVDWHPQDMLYAPLLTPEGRIVGVISMDDPIDGRKPTKENLIPLELFLHQAAITIENAQLIEGLREARKELETYAGQLQQKVEERTRELKKSEEQLLKAQRLAVIGEVAGMVGHDLRNPLTSIAGAEYYLKKRLGSEANNKMNEMLELIEKNIAYSNKIINDLLDYSREIELEQTQSNPKSIIKDALSIVQIPKNIRVIDLTENKPKIRVDAEKIRRIFVNIIKNAIEAMPKGGVLRIKSTKSNRNLEITVSDTGVGMSKETLAKLWTPLFTTKAKGMGFGLSICKRLVEAHGGSISVDSTRGKGTTITVTFPIEPRVKEGGEKVWVKPLESSLLTTTKT